MNVTPINFKGKNYNSSTIKAVKEGVELARQNYNNETGKGIFGKALKSHNADTRLIVSIKQIIKNISKNFKLGIK